MRTLIILLLFALILSFTPSTGWAEKHTNKDPAGSMPFHPPSKKDEEQRSWMMMGNIDTGYSWSPQSKIPPHKNKRKQRLKQIEYLGPNDKCWAE